MKTLTKLIGLIALATLTTLVLAWSSNTLWTWFVSTSGPGIKGWFAVFTIATLVFQQNTTQLAKLKLDEGCSVYKHAFQNHVSIIIGSLMTVGLTWLTGQALNWI